MRNFLKRLLTLRIRRQKRFRGRPGLSVMLQHSRVKNQIETISLGGLSFYYIDNGRPPGGRAGVLHVVDDQRPLIAHIPFKPVAIHKIGESILPYQKINRCSVRFHRLDRRKKAALKKLIRTCCSRNGGNLALEHVWG